MIVGGVKDRSKPMTSKEAKQVDANASQGFSKKNEYPTLNQWALDISQKFSAQ